MSGRVVPLPTTTRIRGEATGTFLAQPDLAPSTRRSLIGYCRRRRRLVDDLTVDLDRRPDPADRTNAIPLPELERLWRRDDVGVREKAPWRLPYETAARAGEVLSINVEDLELDNKRVRVSSKGNSAPLSEAARGELRRRHESPFSARRSLQLPSTTPVVSASI